MRLSSFLLLFWPFWFLVTGTTSLEFQPVQDNATWHEVGPGLPLIASFTPEDYRGHPQIWGLIRDSRGFVYAGNSEGFLMYDGARWQRVFTESRSFVKKFAAGHDCVIYALGKTDLGYIGTDSLGRTIFHSLGIRPPEPGSDLLDAVDSSVDSGDSGNTDLHDTKDIAADSSNTYFLIGDRLFVRDGSFVTPMPGELRFQRLFEVEGEVYALKSDHGLYNLTTAQHHPLYPHEILHREQIVSIAGIGRGDRLLVTSSGNMFTYSRSTGKLSRFEHNFQHLLENNPVLESIRTGERTFALATMRGGVILFGEEGRIISHIHEGNGLNHSFVHNLYKDSSNLLWVSTDRGVNLIDLNPHISFFDKRNGLEGRVESIIRKAGNLLLATSTGLFKIGDSQRIELLQHLNMELWDLKYHEGSGQLLLGGSDGLFDITGLEPEPVAPYYVHEMIFPSLLPGYLLAVTGSGVLVLFKDADDTSSWSFTGMVPAVRPNARFFTEAVDGTIWLGSMTGGVYRIRVTDTGSSETPVGPDTLFDVKYYPTLSDYHRGGAFPAFAGGVLRVTSPQGVFRFNELADRFEPDTVWGPDFGGEHSEPVWRLFESSRGTVYLYHGLLPHTKVTAFHPKVVHPPDSTEKLLPKDDSSQERLITSRQTEWIAFSEPFRSMPSSPLWEFYEDHDGMIWIGGNEALFTYREEAFHPPKLYEELVIRMVTANRDSLVADVSGVAPAGALSVFPGRLAATPLAFEFDKDVKHVRIDFALPLYRGGGPNEYRYRLPGISDRWSEWSPDAYAPLLNIGSGNYTFEVQARNAAVDSVFTASLQFRILPPWYRTFAAIMMFAMAGVAASFAGARYISLKQLRRRLVRLERERDVQQERERMSQELHDHLGSNLSNMIAGLELAGLFVSKGDQHQLEEKLAELHGYARGAMQNLRHTIWSLDDLASSVSGLKNHIRDFLKEMQYDRDMLTIRLVDNWTDDTPLIPSQALNLFRIVQEAVQNAVKHSGAGRISIALNRTRRNKWEILVVDDGCGFDTRSDPPSGHYGLYNMKRRALKAMAELNTVSEPGKGTEVRIVFSVIS